MRIKGIDIKINWSLFLIGTFISVTLATGFYPSAAPGWGAAAYLLAGVLSFVGLYASVLLHELAHAVVAQKRGIKVDSIVLHLLGGVSNLKEEPRRPRDEFWIAVVGPLASLNLAGIFFIVANLLAASSPLIAVMVFYLAVINLMLGLFNLLPAYPLDGGRILRSAVWAGTRNLVKATRWVSVVGRLFGWGFVGLGFFLLFSGSLFDGLWMMMIGWFLTTSARLSYVQTLTTRGLEGVTVGQVMWRSDPILSPELPLNLAAQAFFGLERGRVLPVVENGYLLGVLQPEQLRQIKPLEWSQKRVVEVMTRRGSLLAFRPGDVLQQALEQMVAKPTTYAAVIGDGGQFAGLLYLSDIPRFLEMQQFLGVVDQNGDRRDLSPTESVVPEGANARPRELDKVA